MKGGIEFALIMLFGMTFTAIAVGMIGVLAQLHDARLLQESVVSAIEHHSTDQVDDIFRNQSICLECRIKLVKNTDQRVQVTIVFPIRIPVIEYRSYGRISAMTIPIK